MKQTNIIYATFHSRVCPGQIHIQTVKKLKCTIVSAVLYISRACMMYTVVISGGVRKSEFYSEWNKLARIRFPLCVCVCTQRHAFIYYQHLLLIQGTHLYTPWNWFLMQFLLKLFSLYARGDMFSSKCARHTRYALSHWIIFLISLFPL